MPAWLRHPITFWITLRAFPITKRGQRRRIERYVREMHHDVGARARFR